jgi:hypothetical protein
MTCKKDSFIRRGMTCPFCFGNQESGCLAGISAYILEQQSEVMFDRNSNSGKAARYLLAKRAKELRSNLIIGEVEQ